MQDSEIFNRSIRIKIIGSKKNLYLRVDLYFSGLKNTVA